MQAKKAKISDAVAIIGFMFVFGNAFNAEAKSAGGAVELGAGVAITSEALESTAFRQLVTLKIRQPDIGPRISHQIERVELQSSGPRVVLAPAVPMPEDRLNVRVVYNGFLPDESPIDFTKEN